MPTTPIYRLSTVATLSVQPPISQAPTPSMSLVLPTEGKNLVLPEMTLRSVDDKTSESSVKGRTSRRTEAIDPAAVKPRSIVPSEEQVCLSHVILRVSMPRPGRAGAIGTAPYNQTCKCSDNPSMCHCWVNKGRDPINGHELAVCEWHSGGHTSVYRKASTSDRCYTENPSKYGYWDANLTCFDLCWMTAQASRDKQTALEVLAQESVGELDDINKRVVRTTGAFQKHLSSIEGYTAELSVVRQATRSISNPNAAADSQLDVYSKIVLIATKDHEKSLLNTERAWKNRCANDPELPAEADDRIAFFNSTTNLVDAETKLKKAKDKQDNWVHKSQASSKTEQAKALQEHQDILTGQIAVLTEGIVKEARLPLYEVYTGLARIRELRSVNEWGRMPLNMSKVDKYDTDWGEVLIDLTKYIPRQLHCKVAEAVRQEMNEIANTIAAIKSTKAVSEVSKDTDLGQVYLSTSGIVLADVIDQGPALVVRAPILTREGAGLINPDLLYVGTDDDASESRFYRTDGFDGYRKGQDGVDGPKGKADRSGGAWKNSSSRSSGGGRAQVKITRNNHR